MEFPETKNKIVCIVATGYAWEDCVFGNPGKDYWTLNNMFGSGKVDASAFDEWFQLHRPGSKEGHIDDKPMREFLAKWKKPTWIQRDWGVELEVVNPWIYPIGEVIERFCPRDVKGQPYPYFTNSVDYMICMAMLRGYEEIQLYGVEFIALKDNEYYQMRQSINYYVAKAEMLGIKVVVQPHSSLLKAPFWYAYENPRRDPLEKAMETSIGDLTRQKNESEAKMREEEKRFHTLSGGVQILRQMLETAKLRDRGAQI